MWPRFNRNDVCIVAHYLGLLTMTFGCIMAVPLAVSIICGEWAISSHYVLGIGIALALGALLRLARIEPQRMGRKHAIAITGLVWIVGAVLAAVPLYLSGHYTTFLDAVFEGVSGLTATGLSLALDVDHLSMADNMWRFAMQFVGGQGVVVVALSLGIFTRTGSALYTSEAREDSIVPNVKNTARFILQFATGVVVVGTVISAAILVFIGMEPLRGFFHGFWITIGAYDTGGFSPTSLSLIPYHSWPLEVVAMVLMMFGALSFAVVAQVNKGNWKEFVRDIEVRVLAFWTVGMVVFFVAALAAGDFLTDYSGVMRRGIFTIISATTNTGFQVLSTAQITTLFSSGAFLMLAVSMAMGGSSASTAGGIKALRVGLILKGIGLSVRRILHPRSARIATQYNHIGKHMLLPELLSSALIIAALYVISYVVGAVIGVAYGYEALHATFESISAASNAGISSGIVQAGMPVPLEMIYILQMWLGRLEFITLLALFASLIASVIPRRKPRSEKLRGSGELNDVEHDGRGHSSRGHIGPPFAVSTALLLAVLLLLAPLQSAQANGVVWAAGPNRSFAGSAQGAQASAVPDSDAGETSVGSEEVALSELSDAPKHLDGVMVTFEGEVVGDCIDGDDPEHVWISLSEGESAITVYMARDDLEHISHYGSYAYDGTRLKVVGMFHPACSQHDGSIDVHVSGILDVLDTGGPRAHAVSPFSMATGLALIAVAAGLIVFYNVLRRKRR